jgi:plasmid stabilization system protein ParE
MRIAMTDRFVAGAKGVIDGQAEYFDAKVRGLSLRVSAGGTRAWNFHYTDPAGRRRRLTLGSYPSMPLVAARAAGVEAAGTVADLVESYLTKHVQPNLRQAAQVERRLRKNVIPVIGTVKLADLHRRDINRAIDLILARKTPAQANSVHADLRAFCDGRFGAAMLIAIRSPECPRPPRPVIATARSPRPKSPKCGASFPSYRPMRSMCFGFA